MRKNICLVLCMLLFISYVKGQDENDPLRYDAMDAKRISYGDSTWITRKDNAPEGELVYSAALLGKPFIGFRVLCGWLRDQDFKNHFVFYYKESVQSSWIELTDFSWDVRTYPSPWYQVSYAYGRFPEGRAVTDFKIRFRKTAYNKDDWDLGYNTLVGRVALFTEESENIELTGGKQYAISDDNGRYWIEQDGYIVLTDVQPVYGGSGAWCFIKNNDLTYSVRSADGTTILSFDSKLGFNDNQKNGLLLRYGNEHKYSHTEGDVQIGSDDSFLIDRTFDGKYTLRRAHDGRAVGFSENPPASGYRISVNRGKAEEFAFSELSDPTNIRDQRTDLVQINTQGKKVKISGFNEVASIQICFISGMQAVQETAGGTEFACMLEPGIYIVNVRTGSVVTRKKIIIK